MNYNYHTHTKRCGHASGSPEEYVLRAIEGKIKYMGFSDHLPLKFKDGSEGRHRIPFGEAEAYMKEIRELSEKYKDKIDIIAGFEAEYYPEYFDEFLENARKWGADYLILGAHYLAPENNPDVRHTCLACDSEQALKQYVNSVIAAMNTGVFTYVAHPDVFNFTGDDELYKKEMRKICVEAKKLNIPLEINFLGIREGRAYPRMLFWELAGEEQCPVTFGFDAHDVNSAFDGESFVKAMEMVEKYKLNYIGKPDIVKL